MFGGLRVRLILLMALALFPLGLISLGQTKRVVAENQVRAAEHFAAANTAAAAAQIERIDRAVGAGYGLGILALSLQSEACAQAMRAFVATYSEYRFAGFVEPGGLSTCHSDGAQPLDYSDAEGYRTAMNRADIHVEVNTSGANEGDAVLRINTPVMRDESLAGIVLLSVPLEPVDTDRFRALGQETDLFGVTASGELFRVSTDAGKPGLTLPRGFAPEDLFARAGTTFENEARDGTPHFFSVTPVIANSYVVVGTAPLASLATSTGQLQMAMPVVFGLIMWITGLVVAYFGLNRLVLRHLKSLRSALRRFALGERGDHVLELDGAPEEFKEAERAFNRMALLLTDAEAQQMTDLHHKEVLLREVHHRVKNNLQMIASIMNMHSRSARSEETRSVLMELQRRVRGLAMLHRSLYTEVTSSTVEAGKLVDAVVTDTSILSPDKRLKTSTELASVWLYPDQAVPLSMWLAEALTNAVKYAGPDASGVARILVTLSKDDPDQVTLTVENTKTPEDRDDRDMFVESTGIGAKLMTAFCRQLEGEVRVSESEESYALTLTFSVQGFEVEDDTDQPDQSGTHAAA